MKMGFLFSGLFWGIILILIGISIIVRVLFNIHFPVFRVVFALIIIYFGIRILTGGEWLRQNHRTTLFDSRTIAATGNEYNIIFSSVRLEADRKMPEQGEKIEVNTVFGSTTLKISSVIPTKVKISAAFSSTSLPDGNSISFGDYTYTNRSFNPKKPFRAIEVNAVFSSFSVIETEQAKPEMGTALNPQ
ncbi:hypothetical protein CHISP_0182 [Chitinispirillum alkaliphilum]|nr:hypothetical protein CHISP_0182 [Chitinispirillum alkaliphilum]